MTTNRSRRNLKSKISKGLAEGTDIASVTKIHHLFIMSNFDGNKSAYRRPTNRFKILPSGTYTWPLLGSHRRYEYPPNPCRKLSSNRGYTIIFLGISGSMSCPHVKVRYKMMNE